MNMFQDWAAGSSDSTPMTFKLIGDTITITVEGAKMAADKFGDTPGAQVFVVDGQGTAIIDGAVVEPGSFSVFVRAAGMKEAVGRAVGAASKSSIDPGDELTITYSSDKALRNGKSMKMYTASLAPAAPIGIAAFGADTEASAF